MSAIDKDREIAAAFYGDPLMKCYDREWIAAWVAPGKALIAVEDDVPPLFDDDMVPSLAEHIVRLHNRQPKYDALVDAVRTYGGASAQPILDAIAALDQEDA